MKCLVLEERGQDFAEYALILGAAGMVAIAVNAHYGNELQAAFEAGIQALRRTAGVGGSFCNLLGCSWQGGKSMISARRLKSSGRTSPILSSVLGLQEWVHRYVVEMTEARVALVRQWAGLFGVLAVVGLMLAIIAPFMGSGMM